MVYKYDVNSIEDYELPKKKKNTHGGGGTLNGCLRSGQTYIFYFLTLSFMKVDLIHQMAI